MEGKLFSFQMIRLISKIMCPLFSSRLTLIYSRYVFLKNDTSWAHQGVQRCFSQLFHNLKPNPLLLSFPKPDLKINLFSSGKKGWRSPTRSGKIGARRNEEEEAEREGRTRNGQIIVSILCYSVVMLSATNN